MKLKLSLGYMGNNLRLCCIHAKAPDYAESFREADQEIDPDFQKGVFENNLLNKKECVLTTFCFVYCKLNPKPGRLPVSSGHIKPSAYPTSLTLIR